MSVTTEESDRTITRVVPSQRLLKAALSGLVAAVGVVGCDDDSEKGTTSDSQNLSDEELRALCADVVKDSEHAASPAPEPEPVDLDVACKDRVEEAKKSVPPPDTQALCAEPVKQATETALKPKTAEEKTINAEQKEYTFAQLTKMCDDRGGYAQIHAACGSQNTCKGFSYGDWGPGAAVLTEHSCTGVNGCLGLSCVVGPEDKHGNKSGKELYELDFGDNEPSSCKGCHSPSDPGDHDKKDLSVFKLYLMEGSPRTAANWLDLTAAEQERKVAFGVHYTDGKGREIQNMAPYGQTLSRKEIERVIAHIRTLKPSIETIKVQDP